MRTHCKNLTQDEVDLVLRLYREGYGQWSIRDQTGFGEATVVRILRGKHPLSSVRVMNGKRPKEELKVYQS